uniref:Putative sodium-coupled neutral amino acid transporter 11 n=1 Tax=Pelusios castaneus TaxID=367368 RepID=A0A8C8VMD9_9SAUR
MVGHRTCQQPGQSGTCVPPDFSIFWGPGTLVPQICGPRNCITQIFIKKFFSNLLFVSLFTGLPYSMKQAGFPLGVLLLFGVAYITDYSIILLIKGGNLSGANTYQALVNKSYGFIGYLILSTLQFMYPFIAMISYNILTGDTLTKVFQTIPGGKCLSNLFFPQVAVGRGEIT